MESYSCVDSHPSLFYELTLAEESPTHKKTWPIKCPQESQGHCAKAGGSDVFYFPQPPASTAGPDQRARLHRSSEWHLHDCIFLLSLSRALPNTQPTLKVSSDVSITLPGVWGPHAKTPGEHRHGLPFLASEGRCLTQLRLL